MKAHLATGGGIRGGALHAALFVGETFTGFNHNDYDLICGDSYGAFYAAMTANGWSARKQISIFLNTNIEKELRRYDPLVVKFLPWNQRKLAMVRANIKLKGLAEYLDGLGLQWPESLIITCTDSMNNTQIAACRGKRPLWAVDTPLVKTVWVENALDKATIGAWITRSMALPGLEADDLRYMDAGVIEHPPMSFLPLDAEILCTNLGYAGDVAGWEQKIPKNIEDRLSYCYERAADTRQDLFFERYPNTRIICPEVFNVDSMAMNLDRKDKIAMMKTASVNSVKYWLPKLPSSQVPEILDYIYKFYKSL